MDFCTFFFNNSSFIEDKMGYTQAKANFNFETYDQSCTLTLL